MLKKILNLFAAVLLPLLITMCSGEGKNTTAEKTYYTATVQLPYAKTELTTTADGTAQFGTQNVIRNPGEPMLPAEKITFTLPSNCDLSDIQLETENLTEVDLPDNYDVTASLPATFNGHIEWPSDKTIKDGKDTSIYGNNCFFPSDCRGTVQTGQLREYKLAEVTFYPYSYNPVTKKIRKITGGTLRIKAGVNAAALTTAKTTVKSSIMSSKVQSISANTADISKYYQITKSVSSTYDYVIITTSAISAASSQLASFMSAKESKGFKVKLVTESEWGGGSGNTAAEHIRSWLKANYLSLGIEYVLLIGNPNTETGDVPMKMSWPRYNESSYVAYQDAPTDYYYAELSGNWDLDNDGYCGEEGDDRGAGGADIYAEVSVGRIPYYGTITDLDHILAKTIAYENETDTSWRKKALLPMEPLDSTTPSYQLGENIKNNILAVNGWSYHRVYELFSNGPTPESSPCTEDNVLSAWKGSHYGLVLWMTHGSYEYAADVMSSTNALLLPNDCDTHPVFTFHGSCYNAYPELSTNLAYTLLKNGAVNTLGATRVSWYFMGQTDFTNSVSLGGMAYRYAKALVTEKASAGDALNLTRSSLGNYPIWMNYLVFNTYGDPSLKIISSSEDQPVLTVNESSVNLNYLRSGTTSDYVLTCYNTGGGDLTVSAVSSNAAWLKTSFSGRSITLSVNTTGLATDATYTANVTVSSNGGTAVVPVTFYLIEGLKSHFGSGATMNLAGEAFGAWSTADSAYQFTLVNDYTWELQLTVSTKLISTPYKITLNGTWEVNWGGGASGTTTQLSRDGSNASVSLEDYIYTVRITEGLSLSDPVTIQWIKKENPLTIHFKEWGSATSYILHPWAGLSGDVTMTYEGYINGAYWWTVYLTDAPNDFWFTFTNTSSQWEGSSQYDRHFLNTSREVFVLPYDPSIYTSRP